MLSRLMTRREQLVLAGLAAALVLGSIVLYIHGRRAEANDSPVVSTTPLPATVSVSLPPPEPAPLPVVASLPVPSAPLEEAPQLPEKQEQSLSISVVGAVRKPGLYSLEEGARVRDAIAKAGNETPEADLTDVNLAAKLMDATTLVIPTRGGTTIRQDGTLVARGSQSAASLNIPEYTISGSRNRQAGHVSAESASNKEEAASAKAPTTTSSSNDGKVNLNTASASELETLPGIGPKLAEQIINYRSQTPFSSIDDLDKVSGIGSKRIESLRGLVTVK